jgi:Protein of unknown function (DUF1553)/Protein of unknown function (DUF1549)
VQYRRYLLNHFLSLAAILAFCVAHSNGAQPNAPKARANAKGASSTAKAKKAATEKKTAVQNLFASDEKVKARKLWSLNPVVRPPVPAGATDSSNPIDAFLWDMYKKKELTPLGPAAKRTLLRRVYLDLIGIPPTPAEQDEFLSDSSPDAYEKVIDRLLASEQYGVRYGRHWLDVLRYADAEERMYAAPGIHLWRDWVINALNSDIPYDEFVRAQLTGYRSTERTQMTAVGRRVPKEPRPDDMFALGFLSRGAVSRDAKDLGELQISAVETVSSAFMGITVACAKCHNHMYDPVTQRDFYNMKALFDPLVIKKVALASPAELVAYSKAAAEIAEKRAAFEKPLAELMAPHKARLHEDRVAMLPPDVQAIIRKPERQRTPAEQKIADDYYPILRIDNDKVEEVLSPEEKAKYKELRAALNKANAEIRRKGPKEPPAFWTVEVDRGLEREPSYILTSGDPERPEMNNPVEPGWPFAPPDPDFREGRVEAFSDWLTAPENPLFARVAVNRLWQWHFGEGLQKVSSDFGILGGRPSNPPLLDWLAAEFVERNFSMKQMHKLMLTSDAYKMASSGDSALISANSKIDPNNRYQWSFRLQRLQAEPVWDSILYAAGNLDLSVGGPSFDIEERAPRRNAPPVDPGPAVAKNRRGAYIIRGFSTSRDIVPNYLQSFDVDDGRAPCPIRTQTVTAPQALFMMNSKEIEKASTMFAERLQKETGSDSGAAIDLGYRIALNRPPSAGEKDHALTYVEDDASRLKGFAWLLFNLDEFLYIQ